MTPATSATGTVVLLKLASALTSGLQGSSPVAPSPGATEPAEREPGQARTAAAASNITANLMQSPAPARRL